MADVFISYHEKSAGELVAQIADALESAGISCWYAEQDVTIPLVFADEIEKQIYNCKIFLLILNKESIQSAHIRNEVGLAFQRINNHEQMALMPVKVENCTLSGALNYYLNTFQITDVIPPNEQTIQRLVKRISLALDLKVAVKDTPEIHSTPKKWISYERASIIAAIIVALATMAAALISIFHIG